MTSVPLSRVWSRCLAKSGAKTTPTKQCGTSQRATARSHFPHAKAAMSWTRRRWNTLVRVTRKSSSVLTAYPVWPSSLPWSFRLPWLALLVGMFTATGPASLARSVLARMVLQPLTATNPGLNTQSLPCRPRSLLLLPCHWCSQVCGGPPWARMRELAVVLTAVGARRTDHDGLRREIALPEVVETTQLLRTRASC